MNVDNGQSNIFKKKTTKKPPPKLREKIGKKRFLPTAFLESCHCHLLVLQIFLTDVENIPL